MSLITGVDLSHHQRDVDFTALAGAARFVFLKATEGTSYVDATFARRWALAKGANLTRGAYHFARPASSAKAQAQHFLRTVGPVERGDLLALDLEVADGVGAAAIAAWAKAWLAEVEDATGRTPILYTGPGFWDAHVAPAGAVGFSRFPLWVAHYTTAPKPRLPKGFDRWAIWQFTSDGRAPGVSGRCDVNRCDESTLAALTGNHDQEDDDMTTDQDRRLANAEAQAHEANVRAANAEAWSRLIALKLGITDDQLIAASEKNRPGG